MRRLLLLFIMLYAIIIPVTAEEWVAPEAPSDIQQYLPEETENFGEDLWFVISSALENLQPSFTEALRTCVSVLTASILVSFVADISDNVKAVVQLVGTVTLGVILFQPVNSLIELGTENVSQISQYGKLLLPVMASALAAQGSVTRSGAVYMATAVVDSVLSTAVSSLLVPMIYVFLCICVGCRLWEQPLLMQMQKFIKWLLTWGLKIVLYVFTGYISITGVVTGTTDATMLKATKLTISGMVPVVGSIISDASEAVLVSAGVMKNAVGVYGLLVLIALWIGPFLQIGLQYMMLKITGGIAEMFGSKQMSGLIKDFSTAMGLVLAMTGTVCLLFLISTICFMKGVT